MSWGLSAWSGTNLRGRIKVRSNTQWGRSLGEAGDRMEKDEENDELEHSQQKEHRRKILGRKILGRRFWVG